MQQPQDLKQATASKTPLLQKWGGDMLRRKEPHAWRTN